MDEPPPYDEIQYWGDTDVDAKNDEKQINEAQSDLSFVLKQVAAARTNHIEKTVARARDTFETKAKWGMARMMVVLIPNQEQISTFSLGPELDHALGMTSLMTYAGRIRQHCRHVRTIRPLVGLHTCRAQREARYC